MSFIADFTREFKKGYNDERARHKALDVASIAKGEAPKKNGFPFWASLIFIGIPLVLYKSANSSIRWHETLVIIFGICLWASWSHNRSKGTPWPVWKYLMYIVVPACLFLTAKTLSAPSGPERYVLGVHGMFWFIFAVIAFFFTAVAHVVHEDLEKAKLDPTYVGAWQIFKPLFAIWFIFKLPTILIILWLGVYSFNSVYHWF